MYLSNNVNIGVMLQQELDHIDLSKVTSDMKRRVTRLCLWIDLCSGFNEHSGTIDLVLLSAQMKWRESVF